MNCEIVQQFLNIHIFHCKIFPLTVSRYHLKEEQLREWRRATRSEMSPIREARTRPVLW